MSMRHWKTHDLVDLFNSFERGFLPLPEPMSYTEHWTDNISFKLDATYEHSGITQPDKDMEFKIDTDIPAPEKLRGNNPSELTKAIREAMGKMTKGDSIMIPAEAGTVIQIQTRINSTCAKLKPLLFTQRKQYEGEQFNGIRVWRLE